MHLPQGLCFLPSLVVAGLMYLLAIWLERQSGIKAGFST